MTPRPISRQRAIFVRNFICTLRKKKMGKAAQMRSVIIDRTGQVRRLGWVFEGRMKLTALSKHDVLHLHIGKTYSVRHLDVPICLQWSTHAHKEEHEDCSE